MFIVYEIRNNCTVCTFMNYMQTAYRYLLQLISRILNYFLATFKLQITNQVMFVSFLQEHFPHVKEIIEQQNVTEVARNGKQSSFSRGQDEEICLRKRA